MEQSAIRDQQAKRWRCPGFREACHRALRADPLAPSGLPTDDVARLSPSNTPSCSRGALRPSCARIVRPFEKEGARECRVPVHPQPRVRMVVVKCTRVFTARSPGQPGIPARNGFTAYTRSPRRSGFLASVASRKRSARLDASVEASGPHDLAVRKQAPSSEAPLASTASHPASVTIAIRPSSGTRRKRICR